MTKTSLIAQEETLEKLSQKKPLAIAILMLVSLLFAVSIGMGMGILGSFIYLIILFPIVIGMLLGHIIYKSALDLKIRQWGWILITSLLSALVLYGMYQYGRYFTFQALATYKLFGGFSDQQINLAREIVQKALVEETGRSGFIGYLLFKAQDGMSIGKLTSSNKLVLQGWLAWLYWLVEFGLIAFFTAITAKDAVNASNTSLNEKA